ncbi:MAG: hypothetical protein K0R80_2166 [Clostridia bacterium]|jgi:hypothetical protein|nr:hypothetical protein [Clostridia bacterium]MDF2891799.1 hypothetical protein [Clostridia bacterium]
MDINKAEVKELESRVEKISLMLEKAKIGDYVTMMSKPKTMLFNNFIAGLARGFGMAIGFTILGAVVIYFLRQSVFLNIPILGNFIAEIVKIVQDNL